MKNALFSFFVLFLGLLVPYSSHAFSLDFGKLKELKETVGKTKKAFGAYSEEEEIEIGGSVAATLLGAAPLVRDDELQDYVNKVGMWVALQSERPKLPWKFGVIDSDNVNAFAAPGGYVILTKGLFLVLNNEAELAAVLGHEIAHVCRKHHLKAMKKNSRMDLAGDLLEKAADDKSKKDRKNLGMLINAGTQLYARGLDRKDEYDADLRGIVHATNAGYDPYALLSVLTTLDSIDPEAESVALLLKTHPPFSKRLEKLDAAMAGKLDKYADQPQVEERFLQVRDRFLEESESEVQE